MRQRAAQLVVAAVVLLAGSPSLAASVPSPRSVQPLPVRLVGASPAGVAYWREVDARWLPEAATYEYDGAGSRVDVRPFAAAGPVPTRIKRDECSGHHGDSCTDAVVAGGDLVEKRSTTALDKTCTGAYRDLADGARRVVDIGPLSCVMGLGDGAFLLVTHHDPEAKQATLEIRDAAGSRAVGTVPYFPWEGSGDARGALLQGTGPDHPGLDYLDFATGELRDVAPAGRRGAVAGEFLVWEAGGSLHRQPRAGGEVVSWPTGELRALAVTPSYAGWIGQDDVLRATPLGAPGSVVHELPGHTQLAGVAGPRFAVVARDPAGRSQVRVVDVASGAVTFVQPVDEAAEHVLALGPGRLLDGNDSAPGGVVVTHSLTGPATLGSPSPARPSASRVLSVSGEHVVTGALRSGSYEVRAGTAYRVGGGRVGVVPAQDLWGPYVTDGHSRFDLRSGRQVWLPKDERVPWSSTQSARVWGDWAVTYQLYFLADRVVRHPTVTHVPTGRSFRVPGFTAGSRMPAIALGDGVLAYAKVEDGWYGDPAPLYVLDLTRPGAAPVQVGTYGDNVNEVLVDGGLDARRLAVDDTRVAWADPDDTVHVVPLPFAVRRAPRVLGWLGATAFSPDGDGAFETWDPEVDVTKPLAGWRLELRDAAGRLVRAFAGSAPLGTVHARWDGRDGAGRAVPDGRYTWTLTGTATDGSGALLDTDGRTVQRGLLTVDRGLRARLTVQRVSAVDDAHGGVVAHVGHDAQAGVAVRADVSYRGFVNGRWTATTRLATNSAATRFVLPGALPQGSTWQVFVTLRDSVGHIASAATVSAVPFDDRNARIRYLAGWDWPIGMAGRYLGTGRAAGRPANADLVVDGSQVFVLADRCPSCADLRVYVDGRLAGTFSAYAATQASRSVVASVPVPRGRHGVRIEVVPRPGRSRFVLDGVAVLM